jgi:hypothetical protein
VQVPAMFEAYVPNLRRHAHLTTITWRRPAKLEATELCKGHLRGVAVNLHLVGPPPGKPQQLRVPHARPTLWWNTERAWSEPTVSQPPTHGNTRVCVC